MGFLDQLTGSSIDAGSIPGLGKAAGGPSAALVYNLPKLFEIQSMLGFLGINPTEYFSQYEVDKKAFKANKLGVAKVGKKYYDIGALTGSQAQLAEQVDTKALANSQAKYEKLLEQPMLKTLAAQAGGTFDQNFSTVVDDIFQKVVAQNLGGGANQGFLNDPAKQATLTQPAAVAKAKYLQDYQQAAQGMLQGLAGLPQTTMFNPNLLVGPQSAASYAPGVMNAAAMASQQNQFNAQMGFNETQAKQQAASQFFNSLMGGLGSGSGSWGLSNPFGGGGGAGAAGGFYGLGMACWVAEDLYGVDDPRTDDARYYALNVDNDFTREYREKGRAWQLLLRLNPEIRDRVRPAWDAMAEEGRKMKATHGLS